MSDLTFNEIIKAARVTVETLHDLGYSCCLFGSTACALYGMDYRTPKDIDVIVITRKEDETIKDEITDHPSNRFFLSQSSQPNQTYNKVYFKVPRRSRRFERKECKVDILVPGTIHIPRIPARRMVYLDEYPDIPLIPLMTLLLLKLQGWNENRSDRRPWKRKKAPKEEEDIKELLDLMVNRAMDEEDEWCPSYLKDMAKAWVKKFVKTCPSYEWRWNRLGFETEDRIYYAISAWEL
ncbi:hypothetical protein BDN72DRAFT_819288 [Pluteus cervinus]|uniref:Uncharacterized protein n=1 Tax=Pluteus cervinus TaxID=181527 RepID=A0ACD3AWQ8_9AGAR|nr:hypothetical protein BDN72DRAFT_819288 [Pluteus cervinus]